MEWVVNHLTIVAVDARRVRPASRPVAMPAANPVRRQQARKTVPERCRRRGHPADERPQQQEQKENVTRAPSPPPKPMFAFLDHRSAVPSAHPSRASLAVRSDPADGRSRHGARRVPASFTSAPAQRVAAAEPTLPRPARSRCAPQAAPHSGCPGADGPAAQRWRAWRPDADVHPGRRWRRGPDPV